MEQTPYVDWYSTAFVNETELSMTILRGYAQFSIKVQVARVEGTRFGKELVQHIKLCQGHRFGNFESRDKISDLVYQQCLPLVERLSPQTLLRDLSLERFLHAPTYHLEIIDAGINGDLRIEGEEECSHTPAFSMSPMPTAELPESCKVVPHFRACDIQIAPIRDHTKSLDWVQGRVMVEGNFMYFKPRFDMREPDFEREFWILSRINEAGLGDQVRVPKLLGIVVSGKNGEITMGFLITMITSPEMGSHLRSPGFWDKPELHKRWEEQVTATVKKLHASGIVWGDVHPMNIVIDEEFNAWAIDFGGMNNVQFVDDKNRETVEGDKQGVTKIFQEWLPSRLRQEAEVW
ncbi:hypothetical protein P153DRAFT_367057 [Dothidotthia symphoricarpi CBS 119687]|uniref:Protein kinase domain-containing protein n=1 Tax=Dothidotthia symphoricarpi CBS 119687 TaxID=1392245 RepID=A0A6A6AD41_9PLEO|nr:uncharacterized protein P153DRAFT_367057 [Dothidotthia symphoricarpi CBS 119687]KAF2129690.1 hypothetical protein P153DRAFT_367057 [Dothidotthia symphoricarpi CBS 119687]